MLYKHFSYAVVFMLDTLSVLHCQWTVVISFQVPVSKFQELRYNVALILKEMNDLEKRNILQIQDWYTTQAWYLIQLLST